ncbi:ATP synthase subunit I [Halomonas sp. TRM85114]|uniref:ATP synthase subunit I n=1 Tax=Halomonas jincaotanensis TaxID=2810616 RepID=UPI001BD2CF97|nr:ATP synthase subunit I [Halomonas jincaotanensis]MBS9403349.1 ATP synthase subunit I [Halomonas jincaotanensis]
MRRGPDFRRLLLSQGLAVLAITLLGLMFGGPKAAISSLGGGLVCFLPNLYFVWRLIPAKGRRQTTRFVIDFYRAEAGKFGLTVALFALVFVSAPPSNPVFFFSAYVAVHLMHWLSPWLLRA